MIGRSVELAVLDSLLDRVPAGVAAIELHGDAGIGKSTVWREGVRRAVELGFGVLLARPTEVEADYAFAGLADLLADVEASVTARIPVPQRRAIDAALLRSPVPAGGIDEHAIGAGLLSVLRILAAEQPCLVAVDDIQWLDRPSRRALAFAARRLRDEPIGLLLAARSETVFDAATEGMVPAGRLQRLVLGPLSVGALHALFQQQLGHSFPRPVLGRIAEACAGNPLYALEVARELDRAPQAGPSLPVPAALGSLVEARVARLPAATRRSLLVAASLLHPSPDRVGGASLAPAVRAEIVSIEDGLVRFRHPLYAAAVYRAAGEAARQAVHRDLARDATDPEERARHLALGTAAPDAKVAASLDAAADLAMARGAPSRAIELVELAIRLTPIGDDEAALRRTVTLTRRLLDTGEGLRAEATLRPVIETAPEGRLRREAMVQLGWWLTERGDWAQGVALMEQALAGETDHRAGGRIEVLLAEAFRLDLPRAREHAARAQQLLDPDLDPGLYSKALQLAVEARLLAGDGADHEGMARSLVLQERAQGSWEMSQLAAGWARGMDELDTARERFGRLAEAYEEHGLDSELPDCLGHLATVELWSGRWRRAEALAREAWELASETGSAVSTCLARYALGLVLARRGEIDQARALASETIALFADRPAPILESQARVVLGEVDLVTGDVTGAIAHLERADALLASIGWQEIFHFRYHGELAEALLQAGRTADAAAVVARMEASAARIPRPWITAVASRCRAMLQAAAGDADGAADAFELALRADPGPKGSFERGRTLLAQGRFLRRARQKRLARTALAEALRIFEEEGAPRWAARAADELRRTAARSAAADLTPTESLIARLAADGLTNDAIAERAFVSTKTVEANLARAYRKLGIGRRAQLSRALDERDGSAIT